MSRQYCATLEFRNPKYANISDSFGYSEEPAVFEIAPLLLYLKEIFPLDKLFHVIAFLK